MCVLQLFGMQIECVRGGNNGGVVLRALDTKILLPQSYTRRPPLYFFDLLTINERKIAVRRPFFKKNNTTLASVVYFAQKRAAKE